MSYLSPNPLVFSGRFQSDVSTVNNDVRHYDTANFIENFQEYQARGKMNGWWNPCSSGAFRLLACMLASFGASDNLSLKIGGSDTQVSGKMVDLDPQMQMVSELWGLTVRVEDTSTGVSLLEGRFLPAPFKDLLFGHTVGARGSGSATAIYQSVLQDVQWAEDLRAYPEIGAIKDKAGADGGLSIRITVFGYVTDKDSKDFTLGYVSGAIGPAFDGEPKTFILRRRFAPINGSNSASNINFLMDKSAARLKA